MDNNNSGFINGGSGFESANPLGSGFAGNGASGPDTNPNPNDYTDTLMSDRGAMGNLYSRYYHKNNFREVVKRIKPSQVNNPEFRNLFDQEYTNLRQLSHENIVAARNHGSDAQGPWYSMEYIDGQSLSEIIRTNAIQSTADKVEILIQILNGLQYVHRNGVIHRDLKPDNIMIANRNRNVKIIDFGLAISDSYAQKLQLAGSKKYMSPEQKINSSTIDLQSDIYSFGLVMVEFLTGTFSTVALGISDQQLRAVADKCLSLSKMGRYRNCGEIISDLNIKKSEIPAEVARLIDEIAADGKCTDAERNYLNAMVAKHNLDTGMVKAMLEFKLEKHQPQQASGAPNQIQQHQPGNTPATPARKKRVKWGAVISALMLTAALGYGAYWLISGNADGQNGQPQPREAEETGDAELAWRYYNDKDHYKDAVEIFRRMSQSSNPETKTEGLRGLAMCYTYGRGITLSPAVALKHIDKALEIDPKKLSLLDSKGEIYCQLGDYGKAMEYWEICQEKDPDYLKQRTKLSEYFIWIDEGDKYYNNGKYDDAVKSYQKAADLNNPHGMCYIGDCYMEGKGVAKNAAMAFEYYQKASACRYAEGELKLGKCYLNGTGTQRDNNAARYWIKQAADQDNQEAKILLTRIK